MLYAWLADLVLVMHLLFVALVVLGGLLAFKWPVLAWVHLPALAWGVIVEYTGWLCPLTPLENWLHQRAGGGTYETDFIGYYLVPLLYPGELTRGLQMALGTALLALNSAVYTVLWWRRRRGSATV